MPFRQRTIHCKKCLRDVGISFFCASVFKVSCGEQLLL